jgi:hypothetical protein
MKVTTEPFWEATYRNDDISTFGIKPDDTVEEFYHRFERN